MKRIMFVCVTMLFALILTAGASVPSQETIAAVKAAAPQRDVPINITDKKGNPIKVESLPRENQAQVERVRTAARSLLESGPGGSRNITVTIRCTYPPLRCDIDVLF